MHVGVSALPGFDSTGHIHVGLETLEGNECDWDYAQTSPGGGSTSDVYSLISTQVGAHPTPDGRIDPCGEQTSLLLVVELTDWQADIIGTPYEIVVAQEPPLADEQPLSDRAEDPQW